MDKAATPLIDYLPRILDTSLTDEERLTLLTQFVVVHGLDGPHELLRPRQLPAGFVFRVRLLRDLCVCMAIAEQEAKRNPKSAMADSAQLWQLALSPGGGIDVAGCGVICTLNGSMTKVTQIDDRPRAVEILNEWVETPPTPAELQPQEPAPTLQ